MTKAKPREPTLVSAFQAIRARPDMYVGAATPTRPRSARIIESALRAIAGDTPAPTAVRLYLWADGALSIAFDGEPLRIGDYDPQPGDGRPLVPEMEWMFSTLGAQGPGGRLASGGAVLNALCERLTVTTVIGAARFRLAFVRGELATPLHGMAPDERARDRVDPLGTSWLSFVISPRVAKSKASAYTCRAVVRDVTASFPGVAISMIDRSRESEDAPG